MCQAISHTGLQEQPYCDKKDQRGGYDEQQRVDAVEYSAVARQQSAGVFDPERTLDERLHKVAPCGEHRYDDTHAAEHAEAH